MNNRFTQLRMPKELHSKVQVAAAQETIRRSERVTISAWIREAVQEKLERAESAADSE